MTAISFIAGMIPLLIATGPGAEERRSIAVLVVGGMTLSLLITLLAVPVIYSILEDIGTLLRRAARLGVADSRRAGHHGASRGRAGPEPVAVQVTSTESLPDLCLP
jgi:HAE1 family hydrophobic/amphiphilic exporter-1